MAFVQGSGSPAFEMASKGKTSKTSRASKTSKGQSPRHAAYNKVRARTKRMNASVRMAFCILLLMGCVAFMATTLQPYRKLKLMKSDLAEVGNQEEQVIERKDAKQRELRAIEEDSKYLELIARDRLNYYEPGEHVFRIQR